MRRRTQCQHVYFIVVIDAVELSLYAPGRATESYNTQHTRASNPIAADLGEMVSAQLRKGNCNWLTSATSNPS
jgi:hypothetical protein